MAVADLHPLLRAEFDAAWPAIEEVTQEADRMRYGRVWLLSADRAHATEWGVRMLMDEALHERDKLKAWARPASVDLEMQFDRLSPAQQRTIVEDFPEPRRGRDAYPFGEARAHMHKQWPTTRILIREGLSDGNRLTDLGWYMRLYLRSMS